MRIRKALKVIGITVGAIAGLLVTLILIIVITSIVTSRHDAEAKNPANNAPTDYQNNLNLHWIKTDWGQLNNVPTQDFPQITQNNSIYTVQNVTYGSIGGTNLNLDLYALNPPAPGSKKPILVYIHGGGMVGGSKNDIDGAISPVLLGLINDGFIVASVNYGLAPDYQYPTQLQEVLCATRFMRYFAYGIGGDQNKLGAFGDSVGGQLVALAGVTNGLAPWENSADIQMAGANLTADQYAQIPSRPNAVADYYGGTELPPKILILGMKLLHIGSYHDPLTNTDTSMADLYQEIYRTDSTLLHEGSAINYITAGEPPFLIMQGDHDTLNPPNTSTDFYNKLRAAGNNATMVTVKNADHRFLPNPSGSSIDPSFTSLVNTTIGFFKNHLGA